MSKPVGAKVALASSEEAEQNSENWRVKADYLRAERDRLREALKPFADFSKMSRGERLTWVATGTFEIAARRANYAMYPTEPAPTAHPEDFCQSCGRPNCVWFAPNDLWNKVMGSPNGIVCPVCFAKKAEAAGLTAVFRFSLERTDGRSRSVKQKG